MPRRIDIPGQLSLLPDDIPLPPLAIPPGTSVCQCHSCNTEIELAEAVTLDSQPYCVKCTRPCEHCNGIFLAEGDELKETYLANRHPTEMRCKNCRFKCADCNRWSMKELGIHSNDDGKRICETCADHYIFCHGCDAILHEGDALFDEDSTESFCPSCYESNENEEERGNEYVHAHDYKCPVKFFTEATPVTPDFTMPPFLYMGVEVEVEGGQDMAKEVTCDFLYCKKDGSLNDGFEIVSHPATIGYWRKWNAAIFSTLRQKGYRSYDTDTCGMHVHVSRSSLSELDILKLLRFFRDNPDFVMFMSRRKTPILLEKWAAITVGNQAMLLRKAKRKGVFSDYEARYAALNTVPSETVEFRLFRGTLRVDSFKRNLEVVDSLISFVKCHSLYRMNVHAFIAYVGTELQPHDENKRLLYEWLKTYNVDCLQLAEREE